MEVIAIEKTVALKILNELEALLEVYLRTEAYQQTNRATILGR